MTVLEVDGLCFRYPGRDEETLREVTLRLDPGEVLGILGPNGSGKSTLLSALFGVRKGHRRGSVRLGPAGYATQEIALYQQLSTRENLLHAARLLLPARRVRPALDACVEEFGLAQVWRRPVSQLSGGWQRLVHLAAAFVHDPPLRILDEPTAALDFETRHRLVGLVRAWRERSVAAVVTSHYPEDLEEMCTRLVVLRDGAVIRTARVTELLAGVDRQLVVELEEDGRVTVGRAPSPRHAAELTSRVAQAVRDSSASAAATVTGVRLTSGNLRDLLAGDPRLTGILDDG